MSIHDQIHGSPPEEIPLGPGRTMTEEEFVAWCDEDTRAEWVDGEVVMMSPSAFEHTDLAGFLANLLRPFVERHDLGIVAAEFQVRLSKQRRRRVPDLLFLAKDRKSLCRRTEVDGAPDLIVEIVSPDSQARDWREKYLEYEAAGVREYWVIDPASERMEAYVLEDGPTGPGYRRLAEEQGVLHSTVFPGLRLPTAWLWPASRPKTLDALRQLGLLD